MHIKILTLQIKELGLQFSESSRALFLVQNKERTWLSHQPWSAGLLAMSRPSTSGCLEPPWPINSTSPTLPCSLC